MSKTKEYQEMQRRLEHVIEILEEYYQYTRMNPSFLFGVLKDGVYENVQKILYAIKQETCVSDIQYCSKLSQPFTQNNLNDYDQFLSLLVDKLQRKAVHIKMTLTSIQRCEILVKIPKASKEDSKNLLDKGFNTFTIQSFDFKYIVGELLQHIKNNNSTK